MRRRRGAPVESRAAEVPAVFKFVRGLGVVPVSRFPRRSTRGRPRHPREPLALRTYWEYLNLRSYLELLHWLARYGPREWFEEGLVAFGVSTWGPSLDKIGWDVESGLERGEFNALAMALIARRRGWRVAKVHELIREGQRLDREWGARHGIAECPPPYRIMAERDFPWARSVRVSRAFARRYGIRRRDQWTKERMEALLRELKAANSPRKIT